MTTNKLKKWSKNLLSLALTLLVMSVIMDYLRKPSIPAELQNLTFQTIQGEQVALADLPQDKPSLIYFWGTWCGYCRYTSPIIHDLATKTDYLVLTVALRSGDAQTVQQYLQEQGYTFPTVNDPQGDIARQWQVNVTPTIILLHKGKMELATTGWTSTWGLKARLILAEFL